MSDAQTTEGQALALGTDGGFKNVPSKLLSGLNDDLLGVVTLLHALKAEAYRGFHDDDSDDDNVTSSSSRATALTHLIDKKVRQLLVDIDPHV